MSSKKRIEYLPKAMNARERAVALRFVQLSDIDLVAIHFGVESDEIRKVLGRSRTIELIRKQASDKLVAAIPAAVDLLISFVREKDPNKLGPRVQLEAAKILLDRTGTDAKPKKGGESKDLNEMSREELYSETERLENEISGRATDITPDSTQDDSEMTELLGL